MAPVYSNIHPWVHPQGPLRSLAACQVTVVAVAVYEKLWGVRSMFGSMSAKWKLAWHALKRSTRTSLPPCRTRSLPCALSLPSSMLITRLLSPSSQALRKRFRVTGVHLALGEVLGHEGSCHCRCVRIRRHDTPYTGACVTTARLPAPMGLITLHSVLLQ
jgi:hypothetical protein